MAFLVTDGRHPSVTELESDDRDSPVHDSQVHFHPVQIEPPDLLFGMNFLCHAMPYLDRPMMAAATGIPDWLSVVDRKIRARSRFATPHVESTDGQLADVAAGVIRHHEDDRWFHGTQAFVTTNLELAVQLREQLPGDEGFRPTFVGHILIEMLLDKFWIEDHPDIGQRYYEMVAEIDHVELQRCVNVITGKPTDKIVNVLGRFVDSKFLYDYLDHETLLLRLNQVMKRVGLKALPPELLNWFPRVEQQIRARRDMMLTPPGDESPFPLDNPIQ